MSTESLKAAGMLTFLVDLVPHILYFPHDSEVTQQPNLPCIEMSQSLVMPSALRVHDSSSSVHLSYLKRIIISYQQLLMLSVTFLRLSELNNPSY